MAAPPQAAVAGNAAIGFRDEPYPPPETARGQRPRWAVLCRPLRAAVGPEGLAVAHEMICDPSPSPPPVAPANFMRLGELKLEFLELHKMSANFHRPGRLKVWLWDEMVV